MHAGSRQVLLLFKEGGSRTIQSPYDGNGNVLHLAFAIPAAESRVGSLALRGRSAGGRPYERRRGCGARPGESEAPYPEYKWYSIK